MKQQILICFLLCGRFNGMLRNELHRCWIDLENLRDSWFTNEHSLTLCTNENYFVDITFFSWKIMTSKYSFIGIHLFSRSLLSATSLPVLQKNKLRQTKFIFSPQKGRVCKLARRAANKRQNAQWETCYTEMCTEFCSGLGKGEATEAAPYWLL